MNKISIKLIIIILSFILIPCSYAAGDFAYNRLYNDAPIIVINENSYYGLTINSTIDSCTYIFIDGILKDMDCA